MSYHENLTLDWERLTCFQEAIKNVSGIVYDLGAGSGVLTAMASPYADFIYAVEIDTSISPETGLFLKEFKNVAFIKGDAGGIDFPKKADYIICEMLDTALIDEEQVPVINSVRKYLKENGEIIPWGIINGVEPVTSSVEHIYYQENLNPPIKTLGPLNIYSQHQFKEYIDPLAKFTLKLEIGEDGLFNGIKITTFTLITPELVCGPTPMMNPPLVIPTEKINVEKGNVIEVDLSYRMGGGLDKIKTKVKGISHR